MSEDKKNILGRKDFKRAQRLFLRVTQAMNDGCRDYNRLVLLLNDALLCLLRSALELYGQRDVPCKSVAQMVKTLIELGLVNDDNREILTRGGGWYQAMQHAECYDKRYDTPCSMDDVLNAYEYARVVALDYAKTWSSQNSGQVWIMMEEMTLNDRWHRTKVYDDNKDPARWNAIYDADCMEDVMLLGYPREQAEAIYASARRVMPIKKREKMRRAYLKTPT